MFQLDLLPAAYGDCIMITYGADRSPSRILIDAGTTPTWKNALRDRLGASAQLELFVLTHIDAFKVSHHGSRGNTNAKLLDQLDCSRYLVSCNGDVHNLPDNETIGRIIHMGGPRPELVFNYDCDRTKAWADCTLKQRYGYSASYGRDGHFRLNLKG